MSAAAASPGLKQLLGVQSSALSFISSLQVFQGSLLCCFGTTTAQKLVCNIRVDDEKMMFFEPSGLSLIPQCPSALDTRWHM